jgi:hypothetical protein
LTKIASFGWPATADEITEKGIMSELLHAVLESNERSELRQFLHQLRQEPDKKYWLRNEILIAFEEYSNHHERKQSGPTTLLNKLIACTQEMIFESDSVYFVLRFGIASEEVYRMGEELSVDPVNVRDLLQLRDRTVGRSHPNEGDLLEIDFQPFYWFAIPKTLAGVCSSSTATSPASYFNTRNSGKKRSSNSSACIGTMAFSC